MNAYRPYYKYEAYLKIIDTAENKIDRSIRETASGQTGHKVVEVFDGSDVIVVLLELDVRVDILQGSNRSCNLNLFVLLKFIFLAI